MTYYTCLLTTDCPQQQVSLSVQSRVWPEAGADGGDVSLRQRSCHHHHSMAVVVVAAAAAGLSF